MTTDSDSPWAQIVGPCYTLERCAGETGMSLSQLSAAANELRALRLTTTDGMQIYPVFQVRNRQLTPGLQSVLQILQTGIDDPWTWAQWLNTEAEGERSIDALWAGKVAPTVRDARQDAWAWSR